MCVSGFSLVEESARRGNEEVEKEILDREVFKASANDSRSATYAREGSRVVYVRAFLKPVLYWTDAGNGGAEGRRIFVSVKLMVLREIRPRRTFHKCYKKIDHKRKYNN